jgi:hypothetical protein
MRDLLGKQLALLQSIAARLEAARRDRAGRVELLRTLWRRAARIAEEAPPNAAQEAHTVEQLCVFCAEIEGSALPAPATLETARGDIDELPTLER